jgi:hypothetical protein
MLLKLCTHKVWHYAYGDMHSTCVGFYSLTYATFFIYFDNDKELQLCYGWTSHLYPFDTFVETIDIFSNCCAQDVEYIKVVKISIVCPWFN